MTEGARKAPIARHMTLREAARALGMPTDTASIRRLRRRLRGLENGSGQTILVRAGGKQRVRYLITMRALRRAAPEMFEERDEVEARRRTERAIELIADALDEVREANAVLHSRLERVSRDLQAHLAQSPPFRRTG